jgi:hypothetical protein
MNILRKVMIIIPIMIIYITLKSDIFFGATYQKISIHQMVYGDFSCYREWFCICGRKTALFYIECIERFGGVNFYTDILKNKKILLASQTEFPKSLVLKLLCLLCRNIRLIVVFIDRKLVFLTDVYKNVDFLSRLCYNIF